MMLPTFADFVENVMKVDGRTLQDVAVIFNTTPPTLRDRMESGIPKAEWIAAMAEHSPYSVQDLCRFFLSVEEPEGESLDLTTTCQQASQQAQKAFNQGDFKTARRLFGEAIEIARRKGDTNLQAAFVDALAACFSMDGKFVDAKKILDQGLAIRPIEPMYKWRLKVNHAWAEFGLGESDAWKTAEQVIEAYADADWDRLDLMEKVNLAHGHFVVGMTQYTSFFNSPKDQSAAVKGIQHAQQSQGYYQQIANENPTARRVYRAIADTIGGAALGLRAVLDRDKKCFDELKQRVSELLALIEDENLISDEVEEAAWLFVFAADAAPFVVEQDALPPAPRKPTTADLTQNYLDHAEFVTDLGRVLSRSLFSSRRVGQPGALQLDDRSFLGNAPRELARSMFISGHAGQLWPLWRYIYAKDPTLLDPADPLDKRIAREIHGRYPFDNDLNYLWDVICS
jgi:hypothetical protein